MKLSRRALRMQRHHKRSKREAGLNMVSLMDIFTILVFFLLVSSGDVQDLPSSKSIKLPESASTDKPRETVVILVDKNDIVIQGKKISTVSDALISDAETIEGIKTALDEVAKSSVLSSTQPGTENTNDREVMIMGDRDIPYKLLKKIMASCTEANFNNISLAVVSKNMDG